MGDNFPWCFNHLVKYDLFFFGYQLSLRGFQRYRVRTSTLANRENAAPYPSRYSSLPKSGNSATLGNDFNVKSLERIGSRLLRSREAKASAIPLTAFNWGEVTSTLTILAGMRCGCAGGGFTCDREGMWVNLRRLLIRRSHGQTERPGLAKYLGNSQVQS